MERLSAMALKASGDAGPADAGTETRPRSQPVRPEPAVGVGSVALLSMRFVSICFNQSCCFVIGTAADRIHGYRLSAVDGLLRATPRRISDSRNDPIGSCCATTIRQRGSTSNSARNAEARERLAVTV
jgi:hypothetical protein